MSISCLQAKTYPQGGHNENESQFNQFRSVHGRFVRLLLLQQVKHKNLKKFISNKST